MRYAVCQIHLDHGVKCFLTPRLPILLRMVTPNSLSINILTPTPIPPHPSPDTHTQIFDRQHFVYLIVVNFHSDIAQRWTTVTSQFQQYYRFWSFYRVTEFNMQSLSIFTDHRAVVASAPHIIPMMTSSNGNIFRVTGHLCGEFTGLRWIPRTKASDAELWCFLWCAPE